VTYSVCFRLASDEVLQTKECVFDGGSDGSSGAMQPAFVKFVDSAAPTVELRNLLQCAYSARSLVDSALVALTVVSLAW
jgi:hypothetical protein